MPISRPIGNMPGSQKRANKEIHISSRGMSISYGSGRKAKTLFLTFPFLFILLFPSISFPERGLQVQSKRLALVKDNGAYKSSPLKKPPNDVYDNGTVKDAKTGLMWAAKDNGRDVTWQEAKEYCEKYRGGGYTDWRMPTQDELAGLYDKDMRGYRPEI